MDAKIAGKAFPASCSETAKHQLYQSSLASTLIVIAALDAAIHRPSSLLQNCEGALNSADFLGNK
jgi:hypothetical protein